MRIIKGKFPGVAAGNCDFTNGQNKMKPNERVVDMQANTEDLPRGALCIHERTVKKMVNLLGWKLDNGNIDAERLAYLELRVLEYETQLATIKESLNA